jgi:hypothetical protein
MKKKSKRHQKLYKMRGCMKKKKSKKHLEGGTNLAYTGQPVKFQPNPFLAYTGTGGASSLDNISLPIKNDVMNPNLKLPTNPYGANPALPNTGPLNIGNATIPTNQGSVIRGGGCGTCSNVMTGGGCGTCSNVMTGGGCGCGNVLIGGKKQKGGKTLDPQGLIGEPWGSNPAKWPGVDGIDGNRNYLAYNHYKVDPLTQIKISNDVGGNRPFLNGGKKSLKKGKKHITKTRKQRGGSLSNFLLQDLINLGRQTQYNFGSAYNAINGFPSPTPVLPWQGQLPRTPNLNTLRGAAL